MTFVSAFNSYLKLLFIGAFLSVLIFTHSPVHFFADPGRSRLELIHADISRGYMENNIPYKLLEGNVHARQDTLEIFCERAIYSEVEKILYLKGNIRMYRGKDTLPYLKH